jgi:hypothetical protein
MITKILDTVQSLSTQVRKTLRVFESLLRQVRGSK